MNVEFIEKYTKLCDLSEGQTAVSKDRTKFFVCGLCYCQFKKKNVRVILNMNKLYDQYSDDWDMNQPVKVLGGDDKFLCSE